MTGSPHHPRHHHRLGRVALAAVAVTVVAAAGTLWASASQSNGGRLAESGLWAAGSSTAGGGGPSEPGSSDPTPVTLDLSGPQFGIAYGDVLPWMTAARLQAALHDAVDVGATWVRLDFSWADVQPTGPGTYHWAGLDRVVATARSMGLNILPTLAYTPKWARPRGCTSPMCAPASVAEFARFARAAAARYRPRGVSAWEIWNEENTPGFWKPSPSASAYVALLDATATSIRAVEPDAFIISGGLTATLTLQGAIDTRTFLTQMCALGANRVVDAVGYHPYTYPFLPTFSGSFATAWNKISQTPVSMTSILAQYGTPGLPIWLTEYGAPASSVSPANEADAGQVSEALQAQMATSAVGAVVSSPSIGALFWYTDEDLPGGTPIDHYGLRAADGTEKPVFAALRQAILTARAAASQ